MGKNYGNTQEKVNSVKELPYSHSIVPGGLDVMS